MMSIDPADEDDSGDEKSSGRGTPVPGAIRPEGSEIVPMEGEGGVPLAPTGDGTVAPTTVSNILFRKIVDNCLVILRRILLSSECNNM